MTNANAILSMAATKLEQRDPAACELFASVAHQHDLREAWLGLAVAHHLQAESALAGKALVDRI
jgi:hypothetical protein